MDAIQRFVMDGTNSGFTPENVKIWAREIASNYSPETDLNEKIASIATSNGLNSEQIQRVVEATNVAVDALTKGRHFNTAKTASVLVALKKPVEESDDSINDYMSPPVPVDDGTDLHEMFGVKPQDVQIGAPRVKVIRIKITKLANAREALKDRINNAKRNYVQAERDLIKTAKRCILESKEDINDLYAMTKEAGYSVLAQKYYPVITHVLSAQHVIEKTAFRADNEYISKDLNEQGIPNIKVINGNHAMLKRFQTLQKLDDDIIHARKAIVLCDDKIKKLKEEVTRIA